MTQCSLQFNKQKKIKFITYIYIPFYQNLDKKIFYKC